MAKVKSLITVKEDNTLWNDLFFTWDSSESYFLHFNEAQGNIKLKTYLELFQQSLSYPWQNLELSQCTLLCLRKELWFVIPKKLLGEKDPSMESLVFRISCKLFLYA